MLYSICGCKNNGNLDTVQYIQNYAARVITGNVNNINIGGLDPVKALMNVRQTFVYFKN